ncbi:hypothetical protein [Rhizobium leguminosarum]|uniref:hypothetical protein n=1 Tax=Rhizobium leguminosarum TaxID=384 RepID=UPI001C95FBF5|nr:hypothetical protein [Rhizobium leguminosarum]
MALVKDGGLHPFNGALYAQLPTFCIRFSLFDDCLLLAPVVREEGAGLAVQACIYTDQRPDLCRELPNWMFDQSYCTTIAIGLPEISFAGLQIPRQSAP